MSILRLLLALLTVFNHCLIAKAFLSPRSSRRRDGEHAAGMTVQRRSFAGHRKTKLSAINLVEHTAAASTIILPTLAGVAIDSFLQRSRIQILSKLDGIGALVTIVTASLASTLGYCALTHSINELCWTRLLPASLSLWLVASTIKEESLELCSRDGDWDEIKAVSIPFAIGCIGSILGCMLSFTCCWIGRNNTLRAHKHILRGRRHFFLTPGHLLLNPRDAAVACGCCVQVS